MQENLGCDAYIFSFGSVIRWSCGGYYKLKVDKGKSWPELLFLNRNLDMGIEIWCCKSRGLPGRLLGRIEFEEGYIYKAVKLCVAIKHNVW